MLELMLDSRVSCVWPSKIKSFLRRVRGPALFIWSSPSSAARLACPTGAVVLSRTSCVELPHQS